MAITKFKSKLESEFHRSFGDTLRGYETNRLPYTVSHVYVPDFKVSDRVFIETKGLFDYDDRRKTLEVLKQHPDISIALVFQKPTLKITKGSKTTYGEWCDKHKITWFDIKDTKSIRKFIKDNL